MKESLIFAAFLVTPGPDSDADFRAFAPAEVTKRVDLPLRTRLTKTCHCSSQCSCGCNVGEECTCPQYTAPVLSPATYHQFRPVYGPGGITTGLVPMRGAGLGMGMGSRVSRFSAMNCGPSG